MKIKNYPEANIMEEHHSEIYISVCTSILVLEYLMECDGEIHENLWIN